MNRRKTKAWDEIKNLDEHDNKNRDSSQYITKTTTVP